MRHRMLIVALIGTLCFISIPVSYARLEGTDNETHISLETEDDDDFPEPDPLKIALTPQHTMAPDENFVAPQTIHSVNQKISGIDVSHYQGNINWQEVAHNSDIRYVYIKATEGGKLVDDTYHRNLQGASEVGLHVGAYHFYRPDADFKGQFDNLASIVKLGDQDLIPIIDIERRGRGSLSRFQHRLKQFLKLVEKHYGVRPILYTSRDFYNKYLSGPFTDYKYMIARYHSDVPELRDNASFVMWQYSATSYVKGIKGHVDRSCMMDNYTLSDILLRRNEEF